MICLALGVLAFGTGVLRFDPDPRTYDTLTERLAEMVVIISLMGAGLKLDRPVGWRRWGSTWRLLGIAMPLTIMATAALGMAGLGLALPMALLLGASLAPTDPVLASDVQVGPPNTGEEDEVRFGLTSEAGLNDALAFPFVHLAILASLAGLYPAGLRDWFAVDVVWKLASGGGVGWAIGRLLGHLAFRSPRGGLARSADGLVALAGTLIAYAATEVVHGYGFLAVFVCGLTLRARERQHRFHDELHHFSDQAERLLMMLALMLFGGAIAHGLLGALGWRDVLVGLTVLFVVRPVAGLVSMIGSPHPMRDRALLSFLGIRGLGSVYYLAYGLNHGDFGDSERVWAVLGFIVATSIVVHGVSATPLLKLLERHQGGVGQRIDDAVDGGPTGQSR